MKETRATVLLSRKAARLRRETGDARYQTHHDHARTSFGDTMRTALVRPLKILATEPVVIAFSIWISFACEPESGPYSPPPPRSHSLSR